MYHKNSTIYWLHFDLMGVPDHIIIHTV